MPKRNTQIHGSLINTHTHIKIGGGQSRKCSCICSCCKCNCNSIKIHRKAALILMHVRIHIRIRNPRSAFGVRRYNGGRSMAASEPNCQNCFDSTWLLRRRGGGGGETSMQGGIQHDFWYCVSIKIFIRSLESKLMRAAYANLCGCLSNRSNNSSSTSLFYSCPCDVSPSQPLPLSVPLPNTAWHVIWGR